MAEFRQFKSDTYETRTTNSPVLTSVRIAPARQLKHIRQNVDAACSILHTLCDLLLDAEDKSINQHLSIKDTNALLSGFNTLFQQSGDVGQIHLLTISSNSWGFLAFLEYSNGNKPLSDSTIKLVIEFYLQDDISRASSRKKDVIQINKVPVPVRFMKITGREAFQQFISQNLTIDIGKSSFYALRQRQIKFNTPLETCGWNKFLKNNLPDRYADLELITDKHLINRIVCGIPFEDCFNRHCNTCSLLNASDILLENININKDENASWSQWKTLNNKVDLHHINGFDYSLLDEIDSQWTTFLLHLHVTTEQKEYMKISLFKFN
ncbi:unnamed protein product [Rotaria sordida]|uniref:Uncharacterized protein n=1 Tax=Rotaria sordida TaxID=392033 RepID=A0A814WP66_9BILA|nr:unnamed protein product [Rotaria sordida]